MSINGGRIEKAGFADQAGSNIGPVCLLTANKFAQHDYQGQKYPPTGRKPIIYYTYS